MQSQVNTDFELNDLAPAYSVVVVDDCANDFFLLEYLLKNSTQAFKSITHFESLDRFLESDIKSPDVVVLDRYMPDSTLSEARIPEIRARHNNCGVIMHTGRLTPSLRSTAAHEGAVAVIEKGSLKARAIGAMVAAAAQVGPSIQ
ncbi:MAG: response regulator [Hyphomonadaceae bacterium]